MLLRKRVVILLVLADVVVSLIPNETKIDAAENDLRGVETRRRRRRKKSDKTKSTSSEGDKLRGSSSGGDGESLALSSDDTTSHSSSSDERTKPKSSAERTGWRKWHRKCQACPEDMAKKWRDPSINWICGAYQRARRSFKSLCMMHYRNCQDGTMFVKIHDHRCANDTPRDPRPHGIHFFYDYKARLSGDSTGSSTEESSGTDDSSDSM
ncbi:uncharacterized protein LOC123876975 isoform X2 [Maniola jurtina]|uniref:uncharacterized protein LOC123876975 isoform X2 n=1 Tax=Maniola jurtina TaxID=191418 RepID=UPI001E68D7BC|nr:uncharacterized protein LOC123876975 isoform X2 [Maniola jurtina]